jgi:hypothetical protein
VVMSRLNIGVGPLRHMKNRYDTAKTRYRMLDEALTPNGDSEMCLYCVALLGNTRIFHIRATTSRPIEHVNSETAG